MVALQHEQIHHSSFPIIILTKQVKEMPLVFNNVFMASTRDT